MGENTFLEDKEAERLLYVIFKPGSDIVGIRPYFTTKIG